MLNAHLSPQSTACPFCLVDFDVIGKQETFRTDAASIDQAMDLGVGRYCHLPYTSLFFAFSSKPLVGH